MDKRSPDPDNPLMRHPVAYLRKSRVSSDRHVSWQVQEAEIKALAGRYGDEPEYLSDWGKSGRGERTRLRPEYLRVRKMIEADEVSVLYAYSLSRLSRSLGEYASLAELCRDHAVRVRLSKEGEFDYSSASGRFTVGILALLAQMEAELAQERARDTIAIRKARGDHVGSAGFGKKLVDGTLTDDPGEDVQAVLEAFRGAGSYQRAARLLNAKAVRSKTGSPWAGNTVRNIVRRTLPAAELAERRIEPRVRSEASFALSRLLRCQCGTLLTGRTTHGRRGDRVYGPYIGYQCYRGRHIEGHPRPYMISEAEILPWIKVEAARLQAPGAIEVERDASGGRDELEARRSRVVDAWESGTIDRDDYLRRVAAIDGQLALIEDAVRIVDIPEVDWSWPPAQLNNVLRSLWKSIDLGSDMRPIRAAWAVPEWRSE